MKIFENIIRNKLSLIFVTFVFSIKPLEFLATNILIANFIENLIDPIIFHLTIYAVYITLFLICLNFKEQLFNKIFIFLAIIYYLQFFAQDFKNLLFSILGNKNEITTEIFVVISIIVASLFFSQFYLISKNKKLWCWAVGSICLIQASILLTNLVFSLNLDSKKKFNTSQNYKKLSKDSKISGENVYYIILDGLTSYDYLKNELKIENETFKQFNQSIKNFKFKIYKNSYSSYNTTYLTLGSILEMNYFSENFQYKNRDNFFPSLLYKLNPPKLIENLDNIGYKFIYSGNHLIKCKDSSANFSCGNKVINKKENKQSFKRLLDFINKDSVKVFLRQSIIKSILIRIPTKPSPQVDGIDNFLDSSFKSIKPYSRKFYFIHNMLPHPPYLNKDCKLNNYNDAGSDWGNENDYSNSISCALKKTLYSIEKILEIDASAIIIVQSDHGPSFNYDWTKHPSNINEQYLRERFAIFNSIKIPKKCNLYDLESLGQVETIKLIFNCISNNKEKINIKNKSFAGFYENNGNFYGKLYEVTNYLKKKNN